MDAAEAAARTLASCLLKLPLAATEELWPSELEVPVPVPSINIISHAKHIYQET